MSGGARLLFFTGADFCSTFGVMSTSKAPPSLPTVVDEAGDTPNWVPTLGALLFGVIALMVAAHVAMREEPVAQPAPTVQQAP